MEWPSMMSEENRSRCELVIKECFNLHKSGVQLDVILKKLKTEGYGMGEAAAILHEAGIVYFGEGKGIVYSSGLWASANRS